MNDVKNIPITDIADFESVDVVEVLVKAGDEVAIEQPLVTIESEKAMIDYPSPLAGVVQKVIVQDGDKVKEGDTLITLKVSADTSVSTSKDKVTEQQVEIQIKYEGYILRQLNEIKKYKDLEKINIPKNFDYSKAHGLSNELREKLNQILPKSLGQASRIDGMTPAAISVLMVGISAFQRKSTT